MAQTTYVCRDTKETPPALGTDMCLYVELEVVTQNKVFNPTRTVLTQAAMCSCETMVQRHKVFLRDHWYTGPEGTKSTQGHSHTQVAERPNGTSVLPRAQS